MRYSGHKLRGSSVVTEPQRNCARSVSDGRFRTLWHGTTAQGSQRIRDNEGNPVTGRPEMISEFFAGGGIAQVFDAMRVRVAGRTSVALIGLGTGTLACSMRPGDLLTYYEIDP